MGRSPCCGEIGLKKGPWTPEEDRKLVDCVAAHGGPGNWKSLPKLAGLNRCGKSCRLRWINYLRPDIKRGNFSEEEEAVIIDLHSSLGNKWSKIATYLPGRTDNEIKNFWNTHLRKKLLKMGIDPVTHRPRADLSFLGNCDIGVLIRLLQAEATQLAQTQFLQNILRANSTISNQDSTGLDRYKVLIGNYGSNNKLNSYLRVQETSAMNCDDPLRSLLGLSSPIFIVPKPAAEEQVSNNNLSDEFRGWYDILEENPSLPALFSVSDLETSQLVINEMGSTNVDKTSFSEVFESCNNWEKLMDDGNSGSFWEGL